MAVKADTPATATTTAIAANATPTARLNLQGLVSTAPTIAKKTNSRRQRGICRRSSDTHQIDAANVPYCTKTLDLLALKGEQLDLAIRDLLHTLFPGVGAKTARFFHTKRVSGAMTNAVYFVTVDKQTMLLRIYGTGCDQIIDREHELRWLSRLAQLGLGPRLLGIFGNGRFEEYLPSTTLTNNDIRDPSISQQIGSRFRQLHSIINIYPPPENHTCHTVWHNIDRWFRTLRTMNVPKVDFDQLEHDIAKCKSILDKLDSPTVFAHNDAQYGNILKLKDTGDLVVVDFEYAGYNPRGYDLANHFCEWMYDYHGDTPASMQQDQFPTKEEQLRFLQAYLDQENHPSVTLEELQKETIMWVMASHLHWGLWGLVQSQVQKEIDFDYFGYSLERLDAFQKELYQWCQ